MSTLSSAIIFPAIFNFAQIVAAVECVPFAIIARNKNITTRIVIIMIDGQGWSNGQRQKQIIGRQCFLTVRAGHYIAYLLVIYCTNNRRVLIVQYAPLPHFANIKNRFTLLAFMISEFIALTV